ncbi:ABC transporter permease [Amycolatopsis jejuensis]|uniref:ABC transporter permease n=1 Tax=Amycolatopsis jejuensis TaxID=330084 RepID=UPI0005270876|nr:hypothetical protein [Amycolatopsis jejuensis]
MTALETRTLPKWAVSALFLAPALLLLAVLLGAVVVFAFQAVAPSGAEQAGVVQAVRDGALDGFFWAAMGRTVLLSVLGAGLSGLIAVVIAEALVAIGRPVVTVVTGVLLFSPLVVSMAVRGYGWLLVLDQVSGVVNWLGNLVLTPPVIATILATAHAMMPLTFFPILTRRKEIQRLHLTAAAQDLGAGPVRVLTRVIAPLAAPTVLRTGALAFGLSMGAYGIPAIIGRGRVQVVAELMYQNLLASDWSSAFARLVALLAVTAVVVLPAFRLASVLSRRGAVPAGGAG